MHRSLLMLLLLLQVSVWSQIDQKKVDALSRSIDSSVKAHQSWQDSFIKVQDSIYHVAIGKKVDSNSDNTNRSFAAQKRKEVKELQQTLLRIIAGVVLLAVVTIFLLRKGKTKI
jgi:hypothetical protein